jgi:tRNA (mo5U34)-methyltransferase
MSTPDELQAEADRYTWFHQLDLGQGVMTKANPPPWSAESFPPLKGKSVLDIGAWDGGYSFLAEREGAARVVALDHYAWGVDFAARSEHWNECAARGVLPDHGRDTTDFWRADLPGKRGFDLAARVYDSNVEVVVDDFTTMDLDPLGTFDVVLYLGVLYHMPEPLRCLRRVRAVTRHVAAIATVALGVPGMEDRRLMQFEPGNEVNGDFGNWFLVSISALEAMCKAAGFSRVETVVGPPPEPGADVFGQYLAMAHAYV